MVCFCSWRDDLCFYVRADGLLSAGIGQSHRRVETFQNKCSKNWYFLLGLEITMCETLHSPVWKIYHFHCFVFLFLFVNIVLWTLWIHYLSCFLNCRPPKQQGQLLSGFWKAGLDHNLGVFLKKNSLMNGFSVGSCSKACRSSKPPLLWIVQKPVSVSLTVNTYTTHFW